MLVFNHANREGTGSRLAADICPACDTNGGVGYAVLSIYQQNAVQTLATSGEEKDFLSDGVSVALTAKNLAHLIWVLDGRSDSILRGRGVRVKREVAHGGAVVVHDEPVGVLHCDRVASPYEGYAVHIRALLTGDNDAQYWEDGRIVLNQAESAALRDSLRASMGRIAFGD